jgi:hypothetical protein
MSYTDSNLSTTKFDYVVAVTQDSVNGALRETLFAGQPEVIVCYAYNTSSPPVPVPIDHTALVKAAKGTDPFAVPKGTKSTDTRVQDLANAGFAFAVKAKLGQPPGVSIADLPPVLTLQPGKSNVLYKVTFAEFAVAEIVYGPRDSVSWFSDSQPSGTVWTFSATVDLDFRDGPFTSLSKAAQARLTDLDLNPGAYSIKQLFYDLNSSALIQDFTFDGLKPTNTALGAFMTEDFVNTYFKALGGAELLGCVATATADVSPSSLRITGVNFFTPAAVSAPGVSGAPLTLNYLCATGGDSLPAPANFGWNWIDPVEKFEGVAALNRNTFSDYLRTATLPKTANFAGGSLGSYISSNCYTPSVSCTYDAGNLKLTYSCSASPGGQPTASILSSGPALFSYSYGSSASSQADPLGIVLGHINLSASFGLDLYVQSNEIVLEQRLVFALDVANGPVELTANIVDTAIVDTYSVAIDENGQLIAQMGTSQTADNSQHPDVGSFSNSISNINQIVDTITQWAQTLAGGHLTNLPVSFVGALVFPGAAAFTFADAVFSSGSDLVSHITYVSNL